MTERDGDLQDGMLTHYLEQVKASDVTVEARIEKEPYDFRLHTFISATAPYTPPGPCVLVEVKPGENI